MRSETKGEKMKYTMNKNELFEFDPVAWCCEYTEYDNLKDFQKQYGSKFKKLDDIRNEATVIDISNSDRLLVQNF
jgi:hypothetical protein